MPGSLVVVRPGLPTSTFRCLYVGDAMSGVALDEEDFLCCPRCCHGDLCDVIGDPLNVDVLDDAAFEEDPCVLGAPVCSRGDGRLLPEHFTLCPALDLEGVLSVELLSLALRCG